MSDVMPAGNAAQDPNKVTPQGTPAGNAASGPQNFTAEYPPNPTQTTGPNGEPAKQYDKWVNNTTGMSYVFNGKTWVEPRTDGVFDTENSFRKDAAGAAAAFTANIANAKMAGGTSEAEERLRNQANLHREQAARQQAEGQRGFQIANRDARVEGSKDAATKAAAQFDQLSKQGAGSGSQSRIAAMNTQDPSQFVAEHRQRSDTQFREGQKAYDAADLNKQYAEQEDAGAGSIGQTRRDVVGHNSASAALSMGGPGDETPPVDTGGGGETSDGEGEKPQDELPSPPSTPEATERESKALNITASIYNQMPKELRDALEADGGQRGTYADDKALQDADKWLRDHGHEGISHTETAARTIGEMSEKMKRAKEQAIEKELLGLPPGVEGQMEDIIVGGTKTRGRFTGGKWVRDDDISDRRLKNIISAVNRRFF